MTLEQWEERHQPINYDKRLNGERTVWNRSLPNQARKELYTLEDYHIADVSNHVITLRPGPRPIVEVPAAPDAGEA